MLDRWIRKGKLCKLPQGASCPSCCETCNSDNLEIYGLCSQCVADRLPLMPLTMAKPGEKLIIKDMRGGKTALSRLTTMGFRQGEVLEVINNDGHGKLILGHHYTRLAVGRGLAQKIMVTLAPQGRGKN